MKTQLDLLIEVYREAQIKLIQIVSDKNTGAGTKTYYNTVLKRLEELMKELEAKTGKYIEKSVPREYKKALDETYAYFQKNHLQMKQPDMFAQIHSDAVHELAREMQYHINLGISQAGRRVIRYLDTSRDNILRLQGLRSSAVKISSGQTVLDMQKDLLQRLSNDGFLTVQYGSGTKAYQVGLDTYTAMVARSTTREAGNLARENQLTDNGYDLMIMTEHYPTCKTCAMLQGRVYSISGKDKRFPPLSKAFASGYRNVHPNCRHVVVPFVEELRSDEELQQAIKRSNEPFEDNRSDDEKALYSKQQADNRRMRSDRSQYERYKARLGDEAPKTFSAFRRIKKADGQNWKDLQKLYRSKFQKTVDNSGESGIIKSENNIVSKADIFSFVNNIQNLGFEKVIGFENYKGTSTVLNELYEDFSKLKTVFPDHFKNIRLSLNNVLLEDDDYAGYVPKTRTFCLNPDIFNDVSDMKKSYKSDVKNNFHPKGTTYRAVVFHEFGHHIEKTQNINPKKLVKKLFEKDKNNTTHFNRKLGDIWVSKNLSIYASEYDYDEFIAEAFAEYFESSNPRNLCKDVINEIINNLSQEVEING